MTELCTSLGIPCMEKNIDQYDVYTADEAFITGTPFCMLPVTSLNGVPIGSGRVGEMFSQLISCWSKNVGVDIIGQIQKWDADRPISSNGNAPTPYRFSKK